MNRWRATGWIMTVCLILATGLWPFQVRSESTTTIYLPISLGGSAELPVSPTLTLIVTIPPSPTSTPFAPMSTSTPTQTIMPTATENATATTTPTSAPTLTPRPTNTTKPTNTPEPTNTPKPTATRDPSACHPSYPTVCIPPPPPDLNCSDIPYRNFKVLPPDPHGFDGNKNGIGCET